MACGADYLTVAVAIEAQCDNSGLLWGEARHGEDNFCRGAYCAVWTVAQLVQLVYIGLAHCSAVGACHDLACVGYENLYGVVGYCVVRDS